MAHEIPEGYREAVAQEWRRGREPRELYPSVGLADAQPPRPKPGMPPFWVPRSFGWDPEDGDPA